MRTILGSIVGVVGASDIALDLIGLNPSLIGGALLIVGGAALAFVGNKPSKEVVVR